MKILTNNPLLLQDVFAALEKTADAAMEHFEGDTSGWSSVIEAIFELYPARDMTRFTDYCDEEEYGLTEHDKNCVSDLWITLDIDSEDELEWGEEYARKGPVLRRLAHEGYRAKQMWAEYAEWLARRPEDLEKFKEFEVRPFFPCCLCVCHGLSTNPVSSSVTMFIAKRAIVTFPVFMPREVARSMTVCVTR